MVEHVPSPQPETLRPQPKVIYSEKLNRPDCPYTVQVNSAGLGDLLREAGMPDERIEKMTLHVLRGRRKLPVGGSYLLFSNHATLMTDRIWYRFEKLRRQAQEISRKAHEPDRKGRTVPLHSDRFEKFLVTKRLSQYLVDAPPERAMAFANKLIDRARYRFLILL